MSVFKTIRHEADICVIGGGISGICAAIAAARKGRKVLLMHERPVWGGNASSEIRMWICGNMEPNGKETGILEEILLDDRYRNPYRLWSCWDGVLFGKIRAEKNLTALMNCSCCDGVTENGHIVSVTGWQMTTQTFHEVKARIFIDCSGDSILAPISGAEFRVGREAASEFGEKAGKPEADRHTMGNSCLIQARETGRPREFIPPSFALRDDEAFARRIGDPKNYWENYWYLELGGRKNTVDDAEEIRDELLGLAYGAWDYLKRNRRDLENWELDWVGCLPGKRESRRYVGDITVTETDLETGRRFEDEIAYGGWPMDDHMVDGFYADRPNVNYRVSKPYSLPYRSLYSVNIDNLMFAGRNISVTHMGLSSTRVMATCGVLGQAAGTAAALAVGKGLTPRGVYEKALSELQQTLLEDDCYLPFVQRKLPEAMEGATVTGEADNLAALRNGKERDFVPDPDHPVFENNTVTGEKGCRIRIDLAEGKTASELRLVFDSELARGRNGDDERRSHNSRSNRADDGFTEPLPKNLMKDFTVTAFSADGTRTVRSFRNNLLRLVRTELPADTVAAEIVLSETWGSEKARIVSMTLS